MKNRPAPRRQNRKPMSDTSTGQQSQQATSLPSTVFSFDTAVPTLPRWEPAPPVEPESKEDKDDDDDENDEDDEDDEDEWGDYSSTVEEEQEKHWYECDFCHKQLDITELVMDFEQQFSKVINENEAEWKSEKEAELKKKAAEWTSEKEKELEKLRSDHSNLINMLKEQHEKEMTLFKIAQASNLEKEISKKDEDITKTKERSEESVTEKASLQEQPSSKQDPQTTKAARPAYSPPPKPAAPMIPVISTPRIRGRGPLDAEYAKRGAYLVMKPYLRQDWMYRPTPIWQRQEFVSPHPYPPTDIPTITNKELKARLKYWSDRGMPLSRRPIPTERP